MSLYETLSNHSIDLMTLSDKQRAFLQEAMTYIRTGATWTDFHRYYMNEHSPLWYADGDPQGRRLSDDEVFGSPFHMVLKDLWKRVGFAQGYLKN